MFNTIIKILNYCGLDGSTVIIIGFGLYGYYKLAKNHFKHLSNKLTLLEKGQEKLTEKFTNLDKKVTVLEAIIDK